MIFKRFWFPEEKSELLPHPAVSVVTNLTSYERASLIRTVGYITLGGDSELVPEVEINGKVFPLTPELVHQYNLAGVDVDMIITVDEVDACFRSTGNDIPPFDPSSVDIPAYLMATPAGVSLDLDQCREEYGRWSSKRDELAQIIHSLTQKSQEIEKALNIARRNLEESKRILRTPASKDPNLAREREPFEQQLAMLNGQLRIVEHRIKEYSKSDMGQLKHLVDAVKQEALLLSNSLADNLEHRARTVNEIERRLGEKGIPLDATLNRYNEASERLAAIEEEISGPNMSSSEREQLELIHEEIVLLDDGSKKNAARLAELQKQQDKILAYLGHATWAAYLMAEQVAAADPMATRALESAKEEFKEAEEQWLRVSAVVQSTEGYLDALEMLDTEASQAKNIIGAPPDAQIPIDDLVDILRKTIISSGEPTPLSQELENRLVQMGLLVPQGHNIQVMVTAANDFLAANRAGVALQELTKEKSRITDSVKRVNEQLEGVEKKSFGDVQDTLKTIASLYDEVASLERQKENVEWDISEKKKMGAHYVNGVQEAQRQIQDLVLLLAEKDYLVAHGIMEEKEEFSHEERLRQFILHKFLEARNVGSVGSVPLIFDDAFMNLSSELLFVALNEIAKFSEVSQSIILTDDPTIANWALEVGPMQAATISSNKNFG